jgi:hypothetical protein
MITALLNALTHQGSDGRFQLLTRSSTRRALEARGKAESEDSHDNNGRPVTRWYLTPAAVTYLRNALEYVLNQRGDERDAVWAQWLNADYRHRDAVAALLVTDADTYKVVTTEPHSIHQHTETLTRDDARERMNNAIHNGQRITLHDGAMTVHTKLGARWTFTAQGHAVKVEQVSYERHTGAHGRGWARRIGTDNPASVRFMIHRANRRGDAVTVEDGGVIRVDNAGRVDPGHDAAGEPCPVWFVPVRPAEEGTQEAADADRSMAQAEALVSRLRTAEQYAHRVTHKGRSDDATFSRQVTVEIIAAELRNGARASWVDDGSALVLHRDSFSTRITPSGRDYAREAAELLGDGARFMRHWRREEDAASIPVDREGALNIIVQALRHGEWTTGRKDGGATLVSPSGESSYWLEPLPEEEPPAAEERGMVHGPHRIVNTGEDIEHTAGDGGKYGICAFECTRCHKRAILADFEYGRVECTEEAEAEWSRERAEALLADHFFKGATAYEVDVPTDADGGHVVYTHERETTVRFVAALLGLGATHGWFRDGLRLTRGDGAVHKVRPHIPADDTDGRRALMEAGHAQLGALAERVNASTDAQVAIMRAARTAREGNPAHHARGLAEHLVNEHGYTYAELDGMHNWPIQAQQEFHDQAHGPAAEQDRTGRTLHSHAPRPEEQPDRAEEAANLAARFMPQEADKPGSRPSIQIDEPLSDGEVLVSVYRMDGRLVVYVDLDGCDSTVNDGTVPMVIQVQGREVYSAT